MLEKYAFDIVLDFSKIQVYLCYFVISYRSNKLSQTNA